MWFDLKPEEESSRLMNTSGSSWTDTGVLIHIRKGVMDFNSVSIILGVEGWRLLAKAAKVFLVPMEPWAVQSCRNP